MSGWLIGSLIGVAVCLAVLMSATLLLRKRRAPDEPGEEMSTDEAFARAGFRPTGSAERTP